jgi:hypothetical protein
MNITGGCYGRWGLGETRPDHERNEQLASTFKVSRQILTNGEDLCLRIYESENGETVLKIETEGNKLLERVTAQEEEIKRLRHTITDMEYHKKLQHKIIKRQDEELKKRKKR